MMFEFLADPTIWVAFLSLTAMEIVLGIDNIVFISVLVSRLPREQAEFARKLGIGLALVFRIILLFLISIIVQLEEPVIQLWDLSLSWKDIILVGGGAFLVYKATHEMHAAIEEPHELDLAEKAKASLQAIILQIVVIDMVFSIDSIITAVGMVPADQVGVMIAAVLVAVAVMFFASGPIAKFVADHPTTKMLALAFLLLIGVTLVADGLGFHIPKGYIYSAMAFSVLVEMFNIFVKQRKLRRSGASPAASAASIAPFTGAQGAVPAGQGAAAAKPRAKSNPQARSQSRPKSAPRKPKA